MKIIILLIIVALLVSCQSNNSSDIDTTAQPDTYGENSVFDEPPLDSTYSGEYSSPENSTSDMLSSDITPKEEPPSVTVPLEDIFVTVTPDESYVGEWTGCRQNPGHLTIYSVNEDEVTFEYILHKGPLVTGTAVARDGKYVFSKDLSPDLEYSFYGYGYDDVVVSGYILFQKHRIVLQFDNELEGVSTVYGYAKSDVETKGNTLAHKVKLETLRANGWTDYTETGHDFLYLRNCVGYYKWLENFTPYSQEYYLGTTVIGKSGDIFAAVSIVYDKDSDEWNVFERFYYHKDGRVLQDEELDQFMLNHGKTDFILPADDADLLEYFK